MNGEDTTPEGGLAEGSRIVVVANRDAGGGGQPLDAALAVFQAHGLVVEHHWVDTESPPLDETVARLRQDYALVVIAGGDGSLNQALPALIGNGAPLGVLPLGTANDFARTLGIPLDPATAARALCGGHTQWVDVGDADGRSFLNVAHVGLGVAAVDALSPAQKRRWRALSYPVSLVTGMRRHGPFRVELTIDGTPYTMRVHHLGVGNGSSFGGGVPVVADARIDDAKLDVYAVCTQQGFVPLFRAGKAVWRGESGPGVWRASGERVSLRTRRSHTLMADGEVIGRTPVAIRVRPGVLPVLAP